MFREEIKPKVGPSKKTLGVQVGMNPNDDVSPDADGNVAPGRGGMSVAPTWRALPPHRIPSRLRAKCPKALGNDSYVCWRMGSGPFESARFISCLQLRIDSVVHGTVEPDRMMPLERFQAALAATREEWIVDEE